MHFSTILLQSLALTSFSLAAPTSTTASPSTPAYGVEKRETSGSYTVPGLGERKKAVKSAGGNTLNLAIAMMETDTMTADYAYGDNKSGDSANFGIMKQNWRMLRACASQFQGQAPGDYNNGAALNSNLKQDIAAQQQCYTHYGEQTWFGGHRDGATGISNPYTADIDDYKNAVLWVQSQIQSNSQYLTDDTRFWVDVVAI